MKKQQKSKDGQYHLSLTIDSDDEGAAVDLAVDIAHDYGVAVAVERTKENGDKEWFFTAGEEHGP